jgi:hypothetical protein
MILNYLLLLGLTGPHFYNGLGFIFLLCTGPRWEKRKQLNTAEMLFFHVYLYLDSSLQIIYGNSVYMYIGHIAPN